MASRPGETVNKNIFKSLLIISGDLAIENLSRASILRFEVIG